MRRGAALATALLVSVACTPTPENFADAPSIAAERVGATTNSSSIVTTRTTLIEGPIRGALPNGTVYDVIFEPLDLQAVEEVSAGIVLEGDGASDILLGTRFVPGPIDATGWLADNLYRVAAGQWTLELELPDAALSALGPVPRSTVEAGIELSTNLGLPVVDLTGSFRWATDEEKTMEVGYETFTVRRGCAHREAVCNPTHAVQAIPDQGVSSWSPDQAWVESYALRPRSDRHYIDPGPLSARAGPDVIWTGEEMIVWGGLSSGQSQPLWDGAAFDPETAAWRTLPPPPQGDDEGTRAVWADEEMVVISDEATVAYHPGNDTWRALGPGAPIPAEPGLTVWTGTEIVLWAPDGIHSLDPSRGVWTELPDPGLGEPGRWGGVLRVAHGHLLAIGSTDCEGRLFSEWTGAGWRRIPDVTLATDEYADCSYPNQSAVIGDRLVIWADRNHRTMAFDRSTGHWEEVAGIPLEGSEGPSGPLMMDDRFLVSRWLDGAIYDPAADDWEVVELPGYGTDTDMVWTGEEVLMWGKCCYGPSDVDAWRWAPPG